MLNHVTKSSDLYTNANIKQQQEILGVDKREIQKNPYTKIDGFVDQSEISELARKLFEKDKEVQKYSKLVTEDLDESSNTNKILDLINSGQYLNNDELAESLLNNNDFLDIFSSK
jgi:tRNA G18 (ribose-2'-O)-methylase SpoU